MFSYAGYYPNFFFPFWIGFWGISFLLSRNEDDALLSLPEEVQQELLRKSGGSKAKLRRELKILKMKD